MRLLVFQPFGDIHPSVSQGSVSIALDLVYDRLIRIEGGAVRAELASEWRSSPDFRVWTFHIRPDARFHDGRPLTAADCAATISELARRRHASVPNGFQAAVAAGDRVLEIRVEHSSPQLLEVLAFMDMTLAGAEIPPPGERPLYVAPGTGPYRVVSADPHRVVLEATGRHFRHPHPVASRVELEQVDSMRQAWGRMMRGQAEAFVRVPPRYSSFVAPAGYTVHALRTHQLMAIVPNHEHPWLRTRERREAISLALDRAALVHASYEAGFPADSVVPPQLAPPRALRYKPAQAAAIVGRHHGIARKPMDLLFMAEDDDHARLALSIQSQLASVGMAVNPLPVSGKEILERFDTRKFDLAIMTQRISNLPWLARRFHSREPQNRSGYRNLETDRLLDEARGAAAALDALKSTLDADFPIIPLFWRETVVAVAERFDNVTLDPDLFYRGIASWTLRPPAELAALP